MCLLLKRNTRGWDARKRMQPAAFHARPSRKNGQRNESNVASSGGRDSRVESTPATGGHVSDPSVGYIGDEIRGGSVGGGKQGFFVQQTIVTAGKLGKSREVLGAESKLAEIEAQEQQTRVTTAVKMAFLRVLAAQE